VEAFPSLPLGLTPSKRRLSCFQLSTTWSIPHLSFVPANLYCPLRSFKQRHPFVLPLGILNHVRLSNSFVVRFSSAPYLSLQRTFLHYKLRSFCRTVKFAISSTITSSSLQQGFRSRKALTQFHSKPLAEARVANEDESAGEFSQVLGWGHHYLFSKLRDAGGLSLVCCTLKRLVS
jgi:hypothetical protein